MDRLQRFSTVTPGSENTISGRPWKSKKKYNPAFEQPSLVDPHELRDRANVMEILVAEEVERQMKRCPSALLEYVKAVEVETYALNRLPPLYAASHEGLEYQKQRAIREFGDKIKTMVRHAFSAVQRDPLRKSTPLVSEDDRARHQMIIEMAAKFPTAEELENSAESPEEMDSHEKAARFRRSSPAPSHRRSKVSAWGDNDGWDADHRYNL
ncbi:MAG: late competence development ComFB family protein [Cyanobacteria bacterium P01_C01_bin.89]